MNPGTPNGSAEGQNPETATSLTPMPFDVIFSGGKLEDESAFGSILAQRFADPSAALATRGFTHVSIVLDGAHALEAVPEPATTGKFTDAALGYGVRLVPVVDLVVPAWRAGSPPVVLRSSRATSVSLDDFGVRSPAILQLLGSAYTLDGLRDAVEEKLRILPSDVLQKVRDCFDWSSQPENLGHLLVSEETQRSIERAIPGYDFPFSTGTYFCSKLVAELLQRTGLARLDAAPERVTPTGLHMRLTASDEWADVTASDYGDAAIRAAAGRDPVTDLMTFANLMFDVRLRLRVLGVESVVNLRAATLEKMHGELVDLKDRMEALELNDPTRRAIRENEADFVDEIVRRAGIVDDARREAFRKTTSAAARGFVWGVLDYDQLIQDLAEEAAKALREA